VARDTLSKARDALARADWKRARQGFEAALAGGETPEGLEGLAMAAWWLDDAPTVFAARDRAFQLYRKRADRRGAGRVALALAHDHAWFRGETAVAAGWYRRTDRLLAGLDLVPEHGYLKLGEADLALEVEGDPAAARGLAAEAAAIGRQLGIVDLEMLALALEGLALVCAGHLDEGMPRLDEATTAAVSGEMEDFYSIGRAYCALVEACDRVRDYERAAQWCDRAQEFARRIGFSLLSAVCRTQHASVLIWRGAWSDAEAELEAAMLHLRAARPPLQGEGIVRIARLRRLQGRREEALELVNEAEAHPLALIERAALLLERGEAAAAARLAERFLRQLHPADLTTRIHGLETLFHARLALADRAGARVALQDLRAVADALGTNPVWASVRLADGLLLAAAAAHQEARAAIEDAVNLYRRSGNPLETGRARLELAQVLVALGERDAAEEEARAAGHAFASLGATGEARRAERLLAELARSPVRGDGRTPPGSLTRREAEVLRFVAQGLSNQRIAARLHLSEFTVKRHVANVLTKLEVPTRAAAAAWAARNQLG
jgi:ATP/maltotriose-dependent transcriptional regulator MalT